MIYFFISCISDSTIKTQVVYVLWVQMALAHQDKLFEIDAFHSLVGN